MVSIKQVAGNVNLAVKVVPRASKNEIAGFEGDTVKVRLMAPPVEGKANEALVKFLADVLNIPRSNIEIIQGMASRRKVVSIRGASAEAIRQVIEGV